MKHNGPWPKSLEEIKANWHTQYDVKDCGYLTPCWVWKKSRNPKGHARCVYQRRAYIGGRLPWMMFVGPIPDGLFVCHKCDNPPCVNPDHLFLGTNLDNMRDCREKGRTLTGEKNTNAKLTEREVRAIRTLFSEGKKYSEIAAIFGFHRITVLGVVKRHSWKHVL